jgi:hypothetical protein
MAAGRVTLAMFEKDWLTPDQAVHILDSVFGKDRSSFVSKRTLLERLRGDMVRAIARESKRSNRLNGEFCFEIPARDWDHASENSIFWRSGDFSFEGREDYHTIQIRHYDVRFEPEASVPSLAAR